MKESFELKIMKNETFFFLILQFLSQVIRQQLQSHDRR